MSQYYKLIHQVCNRVKPSTSVVALPIVGIIISLALAATDQYNVDKEIPNPIIIEQLCTRYDSNFSDYVSADDDLETSEPLTDDAITGIVQQPAEEPETESDDEHMTLNERPPNHLLAIDMCHQLRLYLESQPESRSFFSCLTPIEHFIRKDSGNVSNNLLSSSVLSVTLNKLLKL